MSLSMPTTSKPRPPKYWEASDPISPPDPVMTATLTRPRAARVDERSVSSSSPGAQLAHRPAPPSSGHPGLGEPHPAPGSDSDSDGDHRPDRDRQQHRHERDGKVEGSLRQRLGPREPYRA